LRADELGDLQKAYGAYLARRYPDAEARLRALLDPKTGTLKDPDAIADARMYLAAVLLAEGKKPEASRVLEQLLADRPEYQADPLRISQQAFDALEDERLRQSEKIAATAAEAARRAQEEKAKALAEQEKARARLALLEHLASQEVVVERHSRWIALVPFGVGQFQNRQMTLGWTFLATESALFVGSAIGAGLTLYYSAQANDAVPKLDGTAPQYQKNAQVASLVGNVFAAACASVAIAGVIQAQAAFVPERARARSRPLPPVSFGFGIGPGELILSGRF
jgi:hypothetical protein